MTLLSRSADEVGLPADAEFRAAFTAYLEWGSRIAVENSKPGVHPPPHMPVPRWWWVCDAYPWSRSKASSDPPPEEPPPPELPPPDVPLSFSAHIKPLFRNRDRDSMRFAFDLWAYEDVTAHADEILQRIRAGTMPCDGAWPTERADVLERWITTGNQCEPLAPCRTPRIDFLAPVIRPTANSAARSIRTVLANRRIKVVDDDDRETG